MKTIGIRLADGKFYPLIEEGISNKKSIELITVTKKQSKVKIDVFRTENGLQENAEYLGTLELDNLIPHNRVTLILSLEIDSSGTLQAELCDSKTERKSLIQIENSTKKDDFSDEESIDSSYGNFIRLQAKKANEDEKVFLSHTYMDAK